MKNFPKSMMFIGILTFVVGIGVGLVLANQKDSPTNTIEVRGIRLLSADGKTIATLEENSELPGHALLALLDPAGQASAILSSTDRGGQFTLNNSKGELIAALTPWNEGGSLHIANGRSKQLIELSTGENGQTTNFFVMHPEVSGELTTYPTQYNFLNETANRVFLPNYADWVLLRMIAKYNSHDALTGELIMTSFDAEWGLSTLPLVIVVNTETQPKLSPHYKGSGRFDLSDRELKIVFSEAAEKILSLVRKDLSKLGLSDDQVHIEFLVQGYKVARWKNSSIGLAGE